MPSAEVKVDVELHHQVGETALLEIEEFELFPRLFP